ncbi:cutinase family protein [Gordonia sp. LSe1-13]|uniref:Cutinase family protein n=1 Tax=Gordonia sesuvii TaxID=3116777 RepID=A0ABU7M6X2_9ACTN|nr:cutinase family protein [Gordonia sp. LSe1-13]
MGARFRLTRRVPVVLIAISSCFIVVAAFCLPGAGVARADGCGAGAVIMVGGTNDPEAVHMVGVTQRYTGKKPVLNSDGEVEIVDDEDSPYHDNPYEIIYADYPTTLWPLGAAGYDDSVSQGQAATKRAIAQYQYDCGDRPVVVAGYSQGARVAGDVLSDIGNDRDDTVVVVGRDGEPVEVDIDHATISGELYSDPRRAGDKTGRGIELSLTGVIPGLTMMGPREGDGPRGFDELESRVVSVCVEGDPICDLPDPFYDPIGTIDGLVGYFTKHGLYPFQMYRDPTEASWNDHRPVECGIAMTDCVAQADSAIVGVIRDGAATIGIDSSRIGDFLVGRWTFDLPYGIELSNLQPVVRLVQDVLPPLPYLGYGGYLPDIFVFEQILQGVVNGAPDQIKEGVAALAASARSILLIPVNFVRHWAGEIIGPRTVDTTTVSVDARGARQAVLLSALDDVGPAALVTDASTTDTTSSDDPESGGAETEAAATADSSTGSTSSVPVPTTPSDAATSTRSDSPAPDSPAPGSAPSGEQTPKTPSTPPDTSATSTPHAPDPSATDSNAGASNGVAGGDIETDGAEDNDGDGNGEDQTTGPGLSTTGAGTGSSKNSSSSEAGDDPGSDE